MVALQPIMVFSKSWCPFCKKAKAGRLGNALRLFFFQDVPICFCQGLCFSNMNVFHVGMFEEILNMSNIVVVKVCLLCRGWIGVVSSTSHQGMDLLHRYPLVNKRFAIENGHRNSGFSHEKWWCSILMLVYQRVIFHVPSGNLTLWKITIVIHSR